MSSLYFGGELLGELVVVGAGGFGRETVDVVRAQSLAAPGQGYELRGIIDSRPSAANLERLRRLNVPYLGTEDEWLCKKQQTYYLVAIGDPMIRSRISLTFDAAGHSAGQAVHPSAVLGSESALGEGVIVCGGVQISTNVTLGRHVHVNPNATVGHDAVVEDFVSLNPGSIVSGSVGIESEVLLGANAIVLQGLRVGRGSTIGASACVTKDVPPGAVVRGVPAR